jgi:class 3 adenylate cyclase
MSRPWEDLIQWHDKSLRSLFASHGGQEIDHAGDGFFVAFDSASAAIDCAVAIQRTLADHRKAHGFSPPLRIGLHATEATRSGGGFRGRGVHQAARIASLAKGGEILVSRTALETEISRYPTSEAKMTHLKGISEPIELSTIDWR